MCLRSVGVRDWESVCLCTLPFRWIRFLVTKEGGSTTWQTNLYSVHMLDMFIPQFLNMFREQQHSINLRVLVWAVGWMPSEAFMGEPPLGNTLQDASHLMHSDPLQSQCVCFLDYLYRPQKSLACGKVDKESCHWQGNNPNPPQFHSCIKQRHLQPCWPPFLPPPATSVRRMKRFQWPSVNLNLKLHILVLK